MNALYAQPDMVPVLFKGGPFHRQVHVWKKADAEGVATVRIDLDGASGFYIRSRRWRSLLSTHRALIYAWDAGAVPAATIQRGDPDL